MLVLLFFTSLAVLYYVVPVPEPGADLRETHRREIDFRKRPASPSEAVATPGLIALGRALDLLGRGQSPQAAPELQIARKSR